MEEKDKIIVKWAQEDVETSNNLLNNIYTRIYIYMDYKPRLSVRVTVIQAEQKRNGVLLSFDFLF